MLLQLATAGAAHSDVERGWTGPLIGSKCNSGVSLTSRFRQFKVTRSDRVTNGEKQREKQESTYHSDSEGIYGQRC